MQTMKLLAKQCDLRKQLAIFRANYLPNYQIERTDKKLRYGSNIKSCRVADQTTSGLMLTSAGRLALISFSKFSCFSESADWCVYSAAQTPLFYPLAGPWS